MGYTHYFSRRTEVKIKKDDWDGLCQDIHDIYRHLPKDIQIEDREGKNGITTTSHVIWFNGMPPDDFETFVLERTPKKKPWTIEVDKDELFAFCKTGRRPYDVFVVATLLAVKDRLGQAYNITSDGTIYDWEDGMMLATKALKRDMPLHDIKSFHSKKLNNEKKGILKDLEEKYNIYGKMKEQKDRITQAIEEKSPNKERKNKQFTMKM